MLIEKKLVLDNLKLALYRIIFLWNLVRLAKLTLAFLLTNRVKINFKKDFLYFIAKIICYDFFLIIYKYYKIIKN